MDQTWSWILTTVGVTGFILAGRKVWWCWYINIGCQILWFLYGMFTQQYGFVVASIIYAVVFTQNAIKWTKENQYGKKWQKRFEKSKHKVTIYNPPIVSKHPELSDREICDLWGHLWDDETSDRLYCLACGARTLRNENER